MLLLQEAGLWKAGQGHTSLKEVARVLSTDKKKASKPGAETKAGTP